MGLEPTTSNLEAEFFLHLQHLQNRLEKPYVQQQKRRSRYHPTGWGLVNRHLRRSEGSYFKGTIRSHTPRPCVAARKVRVAWWNFRSVTVTLGKPPFSGCQLSPSFIVRNTPISVPT